MAPENFVIVWMIRIALVAVWIYLGDYSPHFAEMRQYHADQPWGMAARAPRGV